MAEAKEFVKYHGLGNDFIMIDNRRSSQPAFSSSQAVRLCDRHFGIGADGLIFAMPGEQGCDYTMGIFNSDGTVPEMCGNGIRCLARYLQVVEGKQAEEVQYRILTKGGVIVAAVSNGSVKVDMGVPKISAEPSTIAVAGQAFSCSVVGMGNPHCVIFMDDLQAMVPPFAQLGPLVAQHAAFPQGINADFVQVLSRERVRLQVWERGAGPTLACGTGACASVVAAVLAGHTARSVTVSLPGGDLHIEWQEDAEGGRVLMTGPGEEVFRGSISV